MKEDTLAEQGVQRFTRVIEPQEQGQYLRVPFEVPADCDTLKIRYDYQRHRLEPGTDGKTLREEINIIDLALENPDHTLVGASGSDRTDILLHENHATPGYQPQPLRPGTWYLVLGAYRVAEAGCPVQVTITAQPKEGLLLVGDTHTHTVHSDGWYTVEEAIARARQDRLDYLFVTDHNSMTSNPLLYSLPGLTVLPGVEITYYGGHYNLYGVNRPVKTYVANSREEVLAILAEGKQSGALAAINHPCDPGCPWTFGFGPEVASDLIEIWNGPFTPANQAAIDLWQQHLCRGRIWPAIGGSDCHRSELFRTYGAPATFLYARSRSGSDILAAMKQGHAFVGMHTEAPGILMKMGEARMGDVYTGPEAPLLLTVSHVGSQDEVRVINQDGILWQKRPGACHLFEASLAVAGSLFVRVEVRRSLPGLHTLASISNPIYLGARGPQG